MVNELTTPKQRLEAIRLANQTGNVAEACKRVGLDRTSFYRWRKRYLAEGEKGLENRSRAHRSHPRKIPESVKVSVLALSLRRPQWGCLRLSTHLREEGCFVSACSIQAMLAKHSLATRSQRFGVSETAWSKHFGPELFDAEFSEQIAKWNPRRNHTDWLALNLGIHWNLDLVKLPKTWWRGSVDLLVAVDAKTGYACASLCMDQVNAEKIHAFLHYEVIRKRGNARRRFQAVHLSPVLKAFLPYLQDIPVGRGRHRNLSVGVRWDTDSESAWTRSLLEWMRKSPLKVWGARNEATQDLQSKLCRWFRWYNKSFQIIGYPHFGRSPSQLWDDQSRGVEAIPEIPSDALLRAALQGKSALPFPNPPLPNVQPVPEPVTSPPVESPGPISWRERFGIFPMPTGAPLRSVDGSSSSNSVIPSADQPVPRPPELSLQMGPSLHVQKPFDWQLANPSALATPESIFSAIASTRPQPYQAIQCRTCAHLGILPPSATGGRCPKLRCWTRLVDLACVHYQPIARI